MDCDRVHLQVFRYVDGELRSWRRVRVERHLRRCPDCLGGVEFERRIKIVLRRSCEVEVPPGLADRIRRALGEGDTGEEQPV
ncbi:MAG: zf-HC2 domain-containing protein [Acidimicrobiia bacterium]|nr:zf-HC2 domain-containing protein [Acidimicrobiia bacterium]